MTEGKRVEVCSILSDVEVDRDEHCLNARAKQTCLCIYGFILKCNVQFRVCPEQDNQDGERS